MRIHYNSPVILTYAILSLGVFLMGSATNNAITSNFFVIFRTSATDPLQYFRLFSYVLGHADFNHYFGNISMLLLIGPMWKKSTAPGPF